MEFILYPVKVHVNTCQNKSICYFMGEEQSYNSEMLQSEFNNSVKAAWQTHRKLYIDIPLIRTNSIIKPVDYINLSSGVFSWQC